MALSFEERKPEINTRLKYLQEVEDVTDAGVSQALQRLYEIMFKRCTDPRACGLCLVNEGFGQLFLDLWQKLSKYLKKKERDSQGYRNLSSLLLVLLNASNYSQDFGDDLVAHGCVSIMLSVINDDELDEKPLAKILIILYNILYVSNKNRNAYRHANAINILQPLLKSTNVQIQTNALILLSYVVNDKEREILATSTSGLKQLLVLLKQGVLNENHMGKNAGTHISFSVCEILDAINQLAMNDTCKKQIKEQEAIPAIIRMLQDDFSDDEHRVAIEALWNLSFVQSIRDSEILRSSVPVLEKLSKSSNKELLRVCASALWQIKGSTSEKVSPSTSAEKPPPSYEEATTKPGSTKSASAKVMLSYQWDHQKHVLKIKERLEDDGLRVWMDVSNMEGDIIGAMANAVEESDVILMCMSERYRDSKNCRSEASFAYKLDKKIIPLLLEPKYKPDGWLGFLQGMNIYYACYSDEELQKNMPSLLKVISDKTPANIKDDADKGPSTSKKSRISKSSLPPSLPSKPAAANWSAQYVQHWLIAKKFKCPALDYYGGNALQELYRQLTCDTMLLKAELKSDYKMDGPTCNRFIAELRHLFNK